MGMDNGNLRPIERLVDEQEISDEESVFHAARWNTERFDEKGPQKKPDHESYDDGLGPIPKPMNQRSGVCGGARGHPVNFLRYGGAVRSLNLLGWLGNAECRSSPVSPDAVDGVDAAGPKLAVQKVPGDDPIFAGRLEQIPGKSPERLVGADAVPPRSKYAIHGLAVPMPLEPNGAVSFEERVHSQAFHRK